MLAHLMTRTTAPRTTRRSFVLGATAVGASLVIGFRPAHAAGTQTGSLAAPVQPLEAYIRIAPDNRVTILSSQFDMGQGSYFGIATLVNEELDAAWSDIDVIGGYGNPALYGNLAWGGAAQGTGGSTSMASSWERYRKAGAAARVLLVAAAAAEWNVPVAEIRAEKGRLTHGSGKTAT